MLQPRTYTWWITPSFFVLELTKKTRVYIYIYIVWGGAELSLANVNLWVAKRILDDKRIP